MIKVLLTYKEGTNANFSNNHKTVGLKFKDNLIISNIHIYFFLNLRNIKIGIFKRSLPVTIYKPCIYKLSPI